MGDVVGEEVMENKRMKKLGIFLSIAFALTGYFSCHDKHEQKQVRQANAADPPYSSTHEKYDLIINKEGQRLWKAALDSGNCKAYNEISIAYAMRYRETELYYCSLIMANRHHCPEAYFMLYNILNGDASVEGMTINNDDKDSKNLSLYYLFKSRELGGDQAKETIERNFGKRGVKLNSTCFLIQLANSKPRHSTKSW